MQAHVSEIKASTFAALLIAVVLLGACSKAPEGQDHQSFASPEAAVEALVAAVAKNDLAAVRRILGPGAEDALDSGDAVQDEADRADFVAAYRTRHALIEDGAEQRTLTTGENDWPMPIPIVRKHGQWYLDGAAGADEIVYRRIGENELGAIAVCRGFVAAQTEYASEGHDGDPAGIYALKLISDEGLHNGLYWPASEGEADSPAGPFVASAAAEGYRRGTSRTPYHGYYYRMLYRQGANAKDGAREYFRDGLLTEGFALVAWPADYAVSGVMTLLVNQNGVVYQKDLGDDTAVVVESMDAFDPDGSWQVVD